MVSALLAPPRAGPFHPAWCLTSPLHPSHLGPDPYLLLGHCSATLDHTSLLSSLHSALHLSPNFGPWFPSDTFSAHSLVPSVLSSCLHSYIAVESPQHDCPIDPWPSPSLPQVAQHVILVEPSNPRHISSCPGRAGPAVGDHPAQQQELSKGTYDGKSSMGEPQILGQPREGGRGTESPACTYRARCSPAGKHTFSFLEDVCNFPARRSQNARSQDGRAFNHTCGASLGVRQEGWRLLLNQIHPLAKCFGMGNLSQGHPTAELVCPSALVTSKQDRPVSSSLCGEVQFPSRGHSWKGHPQALTLWIHQQMHHSPCRFFNSHLPEI